MGLCVSGSVCGRAQSPPVQTVTAKAPHVFDALHGTLQTNEKTIKAGQTVAFVYTVTNTGKTAQTLSFGSTQRFDIVVTHNDKTVWQMSREQMYLMYGVSLGKLTLAAGQQKTFSVKWKPNSNLFKSGAEWKATAYLTPMKTRPYGSLAPPSAPPLPTDHPAMARLVLNVAQAAP